MTNVSNADDFPGKLGSDSNDVVRTRRSLKLVAPVELDAPVGEGVALRRLPRLHASSPRALGPGLGE